MPTTHRKNFLFRLSLTGLFLVTTMSSYRLQSDIWWVWGIVALAMGIDTVRFGMNTAKRGEWNQAYVETPTNENSYVAGHRAFWVTILLLVVGVILHTQGILQVNPVALMSATALLGLFSFVMFRVYYNTGK